MCREPSVGGYGAVGFGVVFGWPFVVGVYSGDLVGVYVGLVMFSRVLQKQ